MKLYMCVNKAVLIIDDKVIIIFDNIMVSDGEVKGRFQLE